MNDIEQLEDHNDQNLRPGEAPVLIMEDAPTTGLVESTMSNAEAYPDEGFQPPTAPQAHATEGFTDQGLSGRTIMPCGWTLIGDIESVCGVSIAGNLIGNITMQSQAQVEICATASMKGTVRGSDVLVRGDLEGEIDAGGGKVSIEKTARIAGRVRYQSIRMDGGNHKMELHYAEAADTSRN